MSDLIGLFKVIRGYADDINNYADDILIGVFLTWTSSNLRGHGYKLFKKNSAHTCHTIRAL